ncbi:MAG: hypothetical protein BM558_03285 [Roseobacter sp. MedPE-SW]|nr:MAG: hypothetical protein BM558_03285 [Roseobacter sp. MedPE-SW]
MLHNVLNGGFGAAATQRLDFWPTAGMRRCFCSMPAEPRLCKGCDLRIAEIEFGAASGKISERAFCALRRLRLLQHLQHGHSQARQETDLCKQNSPKRAGFGQLVIRLTARSGSKIVAYYI